MISDEIKYAKYTLQDQLIDDYNKILKDGHVMFLQDVIKDLNRKSYLEKKLNKQEKLMEEMSDTIEFCEDICKICKFTKCKTHCELKKRIDRLISKINKLKKGE